MAGAAGHHQEHRGGQDAADDLRDHIAGCLARIELAAHHQTQGHGGIEMATRDRADRIDHGEQRQGRSPPRRRHSRCGRRPGPRCRSPRTPARTSQGTRPRSSSSPQTPKTFRWDGRTARYRPDRRLRRHNPPVSATKAGSRRSDDPLDSPIVLIALGARDRPLFPSLRTRSSGSNALPFAPADRSGYRSPNQREAASICGSSWYW